MLGGGFEKTCLIQSQCLSILIFAVGTLHVQGFEFTGGSQSSNVISNFHKQSTITVGQEFSHMFMICDQRAWRTDTGNTPLECADGEFCNFLNCFV